MNIHPLIVHFPIALLTIYALLEFIRIKKVLKFDFWFYIKATLVIIGSASTAPALFSGKLIESSFKDKHQLIEAHSSWAQLSTIVFGLIAFCYLIEIVNKHNLFAKNKNKSFAVLWSLVLKLKKIVLDTKLKIILSLFGLIALVVTGALGGIIVYGRSLDPFTEIIYKLLFGN